MTILKLSLITLILFIVLINIIAEITYHWTVNNKLLKFLDNVYHYSVGLLIVLVILVVVVGC